MVGVRAAIPGVVYPTPERLRAYADASELPDLGWVEAFWKSFETHQARTALSTPEGPVTYAELDSVTDRFAAALWRLGLMPLDRVLFQSNNCKELLFAFIGCLKAGLIPVCTLSAHREHEIGYLGCHADARAHIVQGDDPKFDFAGFAVKMQERIPTMRHLISIRGPQRDGVLRLEDLVAAEDAATARAAVRSLERDPYQVCVFQLSGGTTGVPKIIARTNNGYLLNMLHTARWIGYRADDVMFMPMPMIHNACMVCFWGPTLLSGATFIIPADLTPEAWGRAIAVARPTVVGVIRALLPRLEAVIEQDPDAMQALRATWSPDAARLLRQMFDADTYAMFGMTEGMNMYTRPDDPLEVIDTMIGRPLSPFDEVRLIDPDTGVEVGFDEVGEMTCRGPYTISGYFNAPERNARAFTADGFYRSGDLMVKQCIDGQIFYAFAGRNKDLVTRGHEKVNCEELENAITPHPAIADCAVVGMPDPVLGERICAFVVVRADAPAPTVADLAVYLREFGLAKFKWPERVEVVDALPLTRVGKLDKAAMRAMIGRTLEREAVAKAGRVGISARAGNAL